jgi:hypothetical protein
VKNRRHCSGLLLLYSSPAPLPPLPAWFTGHCVCTSTVATCTVYLYCAHYARSLGPTAERGKTASRPSVTPNTPLSSTHSRTHHPRTHSYIQMLHGRRGNPPSPFRPPRCVLACLVPARPIVSSSPLPCVPHGADGLCSSLHLTPPLAPSFSCPVHPISVPGSISQLPPCPMVRAMEHAAVAVARRVCTPRCFRDPFSKVSATADTWQVLLDLPWGPCNVPCPCFLHHRPIPRTYSLRKILSVSPPTLPLSPPRAGPCP